FRRAHDGLECDVLGLGRRLVALQDVRERHADPRNDHRPRLHAAQAVDALFERMTLEHVFEREGALVLALATYRDRPRRGLEAAGIRSRSALVDTELVVVVVAGDVFVLVRRLGEAVLLVALVLERRDVGRGDLRPGAAKACDACGERSLQQPAPIQKDRLWRDFRRPDLGRIAGPGLADQHEVTPGPISKAQCAIDVSTVALRTAGLHGFLT